MRVAIQTLRSSVLAPLFVILGMFPLLALSAPNADAAAYCAGASGAACQVAATGGGGDCRDISQCDLVTKYIDPLIYFLSALVGVAVVISIIIGGIEYSSSAGDPSKASAAKNRIRNAIIALVTYIVLFAMLNFLIPGGLGAG